MFLNIDFVLTTTYIMCFTQFHISFRFFFCRECRSQVFEHFTSVTTVTWKQLFAVQATVKNSFILLVIFCLIITYPYILNLLTTGLGKAMVCSQCAELVSLSRHEWRVVRLCLLCSSNIIFYNCWRRRHGKSFHVSNYGRAVFQDNFYVVTHFIVLPYYWTND